MTQHRNAHRFDLGQGLWVIIKIDHEYLVIFNGINCVK